jgi:hypothetical protein
MELLINDTKTIQAVQEEFSKCFPYLKIEFFSKRHLKGEASPKVFLKNSKLTLGDFRTKHINGSIKIFPRQKVSELEELFWSMYGLSVQVFRKSGTVWLETISTDDWTLYKQNHEAKELSDSPY